MLYLCCANVDLIGVKVIRCKWDWPDYPSVLLTRLIFGQDEWRVLTLERGPHSGLVNEQPRYGVR